MPTELETLRAENRRLNELVAALAERNLRLQTALEAEQALHQNRFQHNRQTDTSVWVAPVGSDPMSGQNGLSSKGVNPDFQTFPLPSNSDNPNTIPIGFDRKNLIPNGEMFRSLQNGATQSSGEFGSSAAAASLLGAKVWAAQPSGQITASFAELRQRADRERRIGLLRNRLPETANVYRVLKDNDATRDCYWQRQNRMAKILLWLCHPEPPVARHTALRPLIGLSETGTYKLLTEMTRRGILHKNSRLSYRLSEAGLDALEAAVAEEKV